MNKAESKYFNTANLMDEALMRLLEHKDYEYITVKEVCKKAGVNRSTFYLHYEKMDDLLAESLERLNQTFLSYFEGQTPEIISKIDESPLSELIFLTNDYLLPYLNFVFENKHVMRAGIPPAVRAECRQYGQKNVPPCIRADHEALCGPKRRTPFLCCLLC